ncbi:MAG: hypothetical protein ACJ71U_15105 [Terriglobales bacterium]
MLHWKEKDNLAVQETIKIDPRDFITGPYQKCFKCGQNEFGVLNIHDNQYTRRCRYCLRMMTFALPELRKKVVYIDQFAISNIMKVLNPEAKGHQRTAAEPFWRDLYETLDVVCHLQLVVCPDSKEHDYESLTSAFYQPLKHTFEHFSGGATFRDSDSVKLHQIVRAASCFVRNEPAEFEFDLKRVVHGRIHAWQDKIRISVDGHLPGMVEKLRKGRNQTFTGLQEVFEQWCKEKKTFGEVFEQERSSYGPFVLRQYVKSRQKLMQSFLTHTVDLDSLMCSEGLVVKAVEYALQDHTTPETLPERVKEFFFSQYMKDVPFNMIASSMFASLAAKAAAGQKEPPNQGTSNDITIVSTLLPYCDAMFVDNKCRALLQDIPRKFKLPYPCRVFSPNTGSEFLAYLRDIRDSATDEHLKQVEELYGPNIFKPRGIYGVKAAKG